MGEDAGAEISEEQRRSAGDRRAEPKRSDRTQPGGDDVGSSENELHFPTTTRFSVMFVASKPIETAAVDVTEACAVSGDAV